MTFSWDRLINFGYFCRSLVLVLFGLTSIKAYRLLVSCERKSSYSFSRIFLKLSREFCQGMNTCLMLAVIPLLFLSSFSV